MDGTSATHSPRSGSPLEMLTLLHVGALFGFTVWAFGGMTSWARLPICLWGSLSVLLLAGYIRTHRHSPGALRPLHWLWPLLAFNALVLAGTLNPAFGVVQMEGEPMLYRLDEKAHLPMSSRPEIALRALWLFNALFLSCFNLALIVRQRARLRGLLYFVAGNAFALGLFGLAQNFAGARGLYFGAVPTLQPYFFATFVYHNHWGAFMLLMIALCIGLLWRSARASGGRDLLHSPLFGGIVAIFLLAATAPLSGSRSSSVGLAALIGLALVHLLVKIVRRRHASGRSALPPIMLSVALAAAGGYGVYDVARPMIERRLVHTQEQLEAATRHGDLGARPALYRDTLRMAEAKPIFGWGMGSYPSVFQLFNTRSAPDRWAGYQRKAILYNDAHSDWLQSLAEVGIGGTLLLVALAAIPLLALRRSGLGGTLPGYLLLGCAFVALYAAVEFPFGNIAVVLSWWLCFFAAVGYARLSTHAHAS